MRVKGTEQYQELRDESRESRQTNRAQHDDGKECGQYRRWSLQTGERRLLTRKLRGNARLSPAGRYALAFEPQKKQWTAWRTG